MKRRRFIQLTSSALLATPLLAKLRRRPDSADVATFAGQQSASLGPPWAAIAPLKAGSALALGWTVESLSCAQRGAAILMLRRGDHRAPVHLCRRGAVPKGIAHTAHVDLILMNGAEGKTYTEESIGRAIKTLAGIIEHNERRQGVHIPALATHKTRLQTYGPRGLLT